MSYGLGRPSSGAPPIRVGQGATQDPVLGAASTLAAGILREVASVPPGRRRGALVTKLNKLYPGMGNTFLSEARAQLRRGVPSDQATFDGLRLALANRLAEHIADIARKTGTSSGMSGLGLSFSFGKAVCTTLAAGTTGAVIGSAFKNPSASETILAAGTTGSSIAGCDQKQLEAQARIAEANAQQAQANAAAAAAAQAGKKSNTTLYIALGGGAAVLLLGGMLILKK